MMLQRFFAKLFILAGILVSFISISFVVAQEVEPLKNENAAPKAGAPAAAAAATGAPKAGAPRGRKSTTIDFEDELVQGDIKKPELLFLMQKKQFNFKRLIKLREDFIPEMRRTSEDIKSGDKP